MKKMTFKWLLASALGFSVLTANAAIADRVVASVNGAPILQSQVDALLKNRQDNAETRKSALNQLIDAALIRTTLQQAKIEVPKAQFMQILKQEVERQMRFIASQNHLTYGQFILALNNEGIDLDRYRQQIAANIAPQLKEEMQMAMLRDQVLAQEVNDIRQKLNRAEIKKLADELQNKMTKKGEQKPISAKEYQVRHILLRLNPLLDDAQAKTQLSQIRADILADKISFGKAALDYSKDYLSGANGGDLGYQLPEIYAPAFAKAIVNTPQGQISQPFKSTFGWHILQVTDTKEKNITEDVYLQRAYEMIMHEKLEKLGENWLQLLRKNADIQLEG